MSQNKVNGAFVFGRAIDRINELERIESDLRARIAELEANNKQLETLLAESRANDHTAMAYLHDVRVAVGGEDFPDMVERVKALAAGQGMDSRKKWQAVEEIQSWQERAGYAKDAPITPTGPIEEALAAELAEWKQYAALCDRALAARPSRIPEMMVVYPSEQGKDSERLDWLEANCTGASNSERYLPFRVYWGNKGATKGIRVQLDKAMKAGAQGGGNGD